MNQFTPATLDQAIEIARAAGEIALRYHRAATLQIRIKEEDPRNLVTDADEAAEEEVRRRIALDFPDHAVLGEEGYRPGDIVEDARPTWLVDPIDGTSNFAVGMPFYAVSLGLYQHGVGRLGVIFAPALDLLFAAQAGQGATLNGLPIQVSTRAALSHAYVSADIPREAALRHQLLATTATFAEHCHTVRHLGSAALGLAGVAAGWYDLYLNLQLAPWDTAAGVLLVQEAGGVVSRPDGTPWQLADATVLAAAPKAHQPALDLLAGR